MALQDLNKDTFHAIINSDAFVFIKFYQKTCAPCNMIESSIQKIANESTGLAFLQVDCDKNPSLASEAKLTGVPAMIIYRNGNILGKLTGFQNEEAIKKFINETVK